MTDCEFALLKLDTPVWVRLGGYIHLARCLETPTGSEVAIHYARYSANGSVMQHFCSRVSAHEVYHTEETAHVENLVKLEAAARVTLKRLKEIRAPGAAGREAGPGSNIAGVRMVTPSSTTAGQAARA